MESADTSRVAAAVSLVQSFIEGDLTGKISRLERELRGCDGASCGTLCATLGATRGLLAGAVAVKRMSAQINVLIHAIAIACLIPQILEGGEHVESMSLGAGNTGRPFDLETDRRIAEFKFIHWQGGAESIRQNVLFKDYFLLESYASTKRKELYVLGLEHPLRFLNGGRAISSVLSKDQRVRDAFDTRHGDRFDRVRDYYHSHQQSVLLRDALRIVPELTLLPSEIDGLDARDSKEV